MSTALGHRPDWAWDTYNRWRKQSPESFGHNFESCGWFTDKGAWCRQNADRTRVRIYESGHVDLQHDMRW